jgi:FK506-binding protein 1
MMLPTHPLMVGMLSLFGTRPTHVFERTVASASARSRRLSCCDVVRDLSGDGGCLLRQLQQAEQDAEQPSAGDYVTVHFTGSLKDGTIFHDSREDNGKPLELRIGQQPSEAVLGWELALLEMQVGESAELICESNYAFGQGGLPPKVPADATVHFVLELLSIRNLLSSNNTETVELSDKFAGMMAEAEAMDSSKEVIDVPEDGSGVGAATAASSSSEVSELEDWAKQTSAEAPKMEDWVEQRSRTWVPSATRLTAEHPSGYTWKETDTEMEVRIPIPSEISSGDVDVDISSDRLHVAFGDQERLAGALCGRVIQSDCSWTIEDGDDGQVLQIDLMKRVSGGDLWGYILARERAAAMG